METRANYIAIGSIVLVTILAAFIFVWWLAVSGEGEEKKVLRIVFPGAVTGLEVGGQVFFNGIRVGEVSRLTFAPEDPTRVIAVTAVKANAPLRADTKASLGFSGLTGVAYIELVGGSKEKPALLATVEHPELVAERSGFQDLMQSARNVLAKADTSLTTINGLIAENKGSVNRSVNNIATFTDALASNSGGVGDFMTSLSDATKAFTGLSGRMEGLVDHAQTLVQAIDPQKVSHVVDNISNASDKLDHALGSVDDVVAGAKQVTGELNRFATGLNTSMKSVNGVIAAVDRDKVKNVIASIDTVTSRLAAGADEIDGLISDARGAVASIRATSDAVAGKSGEITKFIDDAGSIATKLNGMSNDMKGMLADARGVVKAIDPARVASIVESVDSVADSIAGKQAQIEQTIADASSAAASIRQTSDAVSAKSEQITRFIDDAGSVASRLNGMSHEMQGMLTHAANVVKAIDPARVTRIVGSIDTVTTGIAGKAQDIQDTIADAREVANDARAFAQDIRSRQPKIDKVIDNAHEISGKLNTASTQVNSVLKKVNDYVDGDGKGFLVEATAAARSIRVIAQAFETRAAPIADGFARFSNRGLRNMETLIEQARQTLTEIQKVFTNFDRNPSRILYGGDNVPVYDGGRKRR